MLGSMLTCCNSSGSSLPDPDLTTQRGHFMLVGGKNTPDAIKHFELQMQNSILFVQRHTSLFDVHQYYSTLDDARILAVSSRLATVCSSCPLADMNVLAAQLTSQSGTSNSDSAQMLPPCQDSSMTKNIRTIILVVVWHHRRISAHPPFGVPDSEVIQSCRKKQRPLTQQ